MQPLDKKAFWLFFLPGFFTLIILGLVGMFALLPIFVTISLASSPKGAELLTVITLALWVFLILLHIINLLFAHLTYKDYKYELRSDGFRKEHGIIWKKYVTIPYEKIQNVDIYRGVFARILGLSDIHIQTAGMSNPMGGSYGAFAEGRLPGIDKALAEQIRDELIKRSKK